MIEGTEFFSFFLCTYYTLSDVNGRWQLLFLLAAQRYPMVASKFVQTMPEVL